MGAVRPVLPQRLVELLAVEIGRAFAGEVRISAAADRRLAQAIRPHEGVLARALCRNGATRSDGGVHLRVPINDGFTGACLAPHQTTVAVSYDPRSGRWASEISAGQAGFGRLCAHVWRVQGRRVALAERDLLALLGAAYLALLSEGASV